MSFHILVVDDQPDINLLFEQNFKKEIRANTFSFTFATNGEEALKILHKHHLKMHLVLILSDIDLIGMSGTQLLKTIKETYSKLGVFMITPWGNEEKFHQAFESGAEEIVYKPINFIYLKNLIFDAMRLLDLKTGNGNDKNSCC